MELDRKMKRSFSRIVLFQAQLRVLFEEVLDELDIVVYTCPMKHSICGVCILLIDI